MRLILPLSLLIAFAPLGCSSLGDRAAERETFEAGQARYRTLAAQTPPDTWRTGADWEFVAFGKDGAVVQSFVFRVTQAPQVACLSGDWKRLEIVGGDATKLHNPAYAMEGRNLQILLSTALCDAYPMYSGELSDEGFVGTHNLTAERHGKVSGQPVRPSP